MTPVCPDPRCAELNAPGAVECATCGKSLVPRYFRRQRVNWSTRSFDAGTKRLARLNGADPHEATTPSPGTVASSTQGLSHLASGSSAPLNPADKQSQSSVLAGSGTGSDTKERTA